MDKITVKHFAATGVYLYVIDDLGRIWRRHTESNQWTRAGELPNEPSPEKVNINLDLSQLPKEPQDQEHTLSGEVPDV